MVRFTEAKQFLGFDYNDYVLLQTALIPWGPNTIGMYIAGTMARALPPLPPTVLSALMAATPLPTLGSPVTAIGPQYAWPFHGGAPGPVPALPLNTAPVQRTMFRVITNDMNVYFVDERLGAYILVFLAANPAAVAAGPLAGGWPMPVPVLLEAVIGQYEFERQWVWLFYERTVDDADADLHVYMEG